MNNNYDDYSSLKNFNFQGWDKDKILEKYEDTLTSREKQITDLTIELGNINIAISNLSDKCKAFELENKHYKAKLEKRVNIYTLIY